MTTSKRRRRAVVAAGMTIVAVAGLAACRTQGSGDAASDAGTVSIMVGGLDKVIYLPAQLTDRLGYFKAAGVHVSLQTQPSGANAETALVAGQVDAVVGFYDHTIDLQTKGKCIESVVQFANVPGEVEVVSTKDAARITSPQQFTGAKLGVTSPGSSTDFLTQFLAGKSGVSTDAYTTVTAGAGATFIAALQNGGIDAGMTTDPTVQQITSRHLGKVLLDMRTEQGTQAALGGLYPSSSLYMSCDYVKAHTGTVQKLADAFVRTLGYINAHSGAQIAQQMPSDYAQGSGGMAAYAASIDSTKGMFDRDGKIDAAGARNALAVLSRFNPDVKGHEDSVDLSKTYTTQFVDAAGHRS